MRRLKIAVYAVIISLFFLPYFVRLVHTGDNMFTVYLNGTQVGVVASPEDAKEYLLSARKEAMRHAESLCFMETELLCRGEEVLWGKIDSRRAVIARMQSELAHSESSMLQKAYEVKIRENIINLATEDEVERLLQAAIDKYDGTGRYTASLVYSERRELPVLTPMISTSEELPETALSGGENRVAGFEAAMEDLFDTVEPERELSFEEYELGLISMEYGDEIEVAEVYLRPEELSDVEAAITEYTSAEEKNEVYKVVSGDTLSGISLKVNLPMEDLIAMNDSLEDQNSLIRPDDELIITVPEPKLKVLYKEEMYYEEDYDAPITYIYNDDWYTSDIVVHQQPSAGHRRVVAVVTFENDKELATDIIKEEVTYEPVAKVVEKGTKIPPTYIKPIYGGRLSSTFGYRTRPNAKGATSNHGGVDWATPVGTTVMASSGGVVARAGWIGTYGYAIYINHPDGRQTRYAHLSKILVSPGQSVSQGQKIALSGNTGASTGPHVHFEIWINGSRVNPLKYVGQ